MRFANALAALTLFVVSFWACTPKTVKNDAYFSQISQYIYAYTGGSIGREDPIRVRFVNAAVKAEQVGQKVDPALFSISPAIEGDAVWEDDRTILLKPNAPLVWGAKFKAQVQLQKIYSDAPVPLFEFDFRVRELSYEVLVEGLQHAELNNPKQQTIVGKIRTSDPVPPEMCEKMLSARQGARQLTVSWGHADGGRTHAWTLQNVERSNARSQVEISWDGSVIGAPKKGSTAFPVPSLDEFEILNIRLEQDDNQYIIVNFSDPVSTSQNIDGLISIDEYSGPLRISPDGNFLRVYPGQRIVGEHNIHFSASIQNSSGRALGKDDSRLINFDDLNPGVRLVGRGVVIPGSTDGGSIIFPFEAVGLNAVDVEIFKIYNTNILQFLQVNELEGENNELERVGRVTLQKRIDLSSLNPDASKRVWQRYALDLKDMIKQDPGAIYQVRLLFRKSYLSGAFCGAESPQKTSAGDTAADTGTDGQPVGATDEYGNMQSLWGGYRGIYWPDYSSYGEYDYDWYEDDDYDYERREDPCANEYYNYEHFARRNVFVSDLGLTAKRGRDNSLFAAVTDLHTTAPVSNVQVVFYNYQLQPIAKGTTASDGILTFDQTRDVPYIMVATQGNRRGYLRMADGGALSLSRFDVEGVEIQKGMKGYLYGERGVWRPGDSLYLNFVLEDKTGKLPAGHPVNFELYDVNGALRYKTVVTKGVGGVYPLHCATSPDAPTGNWNAVVSVGGATWNKNVKIETVKPNRLKFDMDFGVKSFRANDESITGALQVRWLHGAVAKDLRTTVEMQVRSAVAEFPGYKGFVFQDPARSFHSDPEMIYEGKIDDKGRANIPVNIAIEDAAPGKLIASFKMRAFEKGGDFSTDNFAMDYYPFEHMVGVALQGNKWGSKQVNLGEKNTVDIACIDPDGRPIANRTLEVGLYRCDWRWWWDQDHQSNVGQFNSATHVNALEKATIKTDSRGRAKWTVTPATWGRYLVRVTDGEGGHAAGDFFWVGYPDQLDDLHSRNAVAMLPLAAEREKYNVGEEVVIKVPASENGRIMVTLENGARVVRHLWFDAKPGDNLLKFTTTAEMTPAVYAHISLLQPHAQTVNDLPIRMYGVVPVAIENPTTRLQPQIEMADVLRPGEPFTVRLREGGGKACAYTLAIVDEGLLDLTHFKTPNPWDAFFAREALGVKSWDIYDFVLGAYGIELDRILSVGGDALNQKSKNGAQVNRFKPAVRHVGPFYLEAGKTASHTLQIDNYVGSVRVMAVFSAPAPDSKGAYGSAEKTVPVRKPLMILPTLPRVLGPGETVRLPINVFAMEKQVKNATVKIRELGGLATIKGSPTATLNFSEPGEEMVYFEVKVGEKTGPTKFVFDAQGGGESAKDEIEIMVRNPMPTATSIWQAAIEPGKSWQPEFDPAQFAEINNAVLEVSALPPINLNRHLDYLIRYPHGCIEQTTSAAFPQLFVDVLMPLPQKQKDDITKNITKAINKIQNHQDFAGGFGYWPGYTAEDWSSSYSGHFLIEAKNKGYAVPENMLKRWQDYQARAARGWYRPSPNQQNSNQWQIRQSEIAQAYRLYTLALAGQPALSEMNRMREIKDMYQQAAFLLANAYAMAGKPEVAREITSKGWKEDFRYDWCDNNYSSDLRDRSLILETYVAIGDNARAEAMVNYLSQHLSEDYHRWDWNTQSLSTALRAMSKYATRFASGNGPAFAYTAGGVTKNGDASKPVSTVSFSQNPQSADRLSVSNNGKVKLYARFVCNGQRNVGVDEKNIAENIQLNVQYQTSDGKQLDVSRIAQGTDFVAIVTIKRNSSYTFAFNELALTQIFPSGWEITNTRMGNFTQSGNSRLDYQDFRDDRVLTYFDLNGGGDYERTYRIQLNAAYAGRYYLPAVNCESMYDPRLRANAVGWWVEVI